MAVSKAVLVFHWGKCVNHSGLFTIAALWLRHSAASHDDAGSIAGFGKGVLNGENCKSVCVLGT